MGKKFNPWDDDNDSPKRRKEELDPNDIFDKSKEQIDKIYDLFNRKYNGGSGGFGGGSFLGDKKKMVMGAIGAVVLMWLSTGIYTIQPDEEGVILRFGKYVRTSDPGLNWKLPTPFETLTKVSVTRVNKEEIGFRSSGRKAMSVEMLRENSIPNESQMLTTDENIVDINFEVQWLVRDAKDYILNVRDLNNENTVKSVAESAMREVIGLTRVNDVLSEERSKVEHDARLLMQNMLDTYGMGVKVERVQLLRVDPPKEVIDSYRDVQNAKQDKEREINNALAYRNDVVPKARGESERLIQEAEGYKQKVVADALGESARFNSVYDQYKNAKEVTRRKMYLETMEEVYRKTDKIILDKSASSVLPFLPIGANNNQNNNGGKQ